MGIAPSTADCGDAFRSAYTPHRRLRRHLPHGWGGGTACDRDCEETAAHGPMAESIRDLMASSPEAMELLKEFLPGFRPVSVVRGQLPVAENLDVHRESLPREP